MYLASQMSPTTTVQPPSGGKCNLDRLLSEIEALEGLLVRYRS